MAASYPDEVNPGLFLPTTELFDVGDLQAAGVNNEHFRELLVRLSQNANDSNIVMNKKTSGLYVLEEFVDGNLWFPDPALSSTTAQTPEQRQEFRKIINFGALPDATAGIVTKSVAHGITFNSAVTFTRIQVTATDTTNQIAISLPYINVSGTIATNIEVNVDAIDINITANGVDMSTFNTCYVVLEYLKN